MKLFETYDLNGLPLKNRIVMAPMTRSRADNAEHVATPLIAEYYSQRASAGLIISEGTHISPMGIGSINIPDIYSKEQIEGWKIVTDAVHQKGGKIFAQLWHVGRISHPDLLNGLLPLAPSAINPNFKAFLKKGFVDTVTPKAMSSAEIKSTIKDFVKAAQNAFEANFDGVELHAANGYLFHQFFAKCANDRTDEYGGSIENRARLLFDVLDELKKVVDLKKVGVRLSPSMDHTFGINVDEETIPTFEYIVKNLNDYNLAYLHLSGFTLAEETNPMNRVIETAKHFRKLYEGTLMINKGFDKETAEKAIEDNVADLISFGELFIANPDLVERFIGTLPMNKADRNTYYGIGPIGYTDYPLYQMKV
ncbi:N-ethylmaleimide reductase [Pedobacter sp. ok626]|uniref:alkene reductase n=1 Tax=Pedobacter sp. ok626 TaxID=1761882 RepID=UPI00088D6DF8|nr:alkene reductase [Pedobacter sp. ok626]SDL11578.1 N-ethylmaleimide reductase [Pedobacter sp. ok626]